MAIFLLLSMLIFLGPALAVWPQPKEFTWGSTYVTLDPKFEMVFNFKPTSDIEAACNRTVISVWNHGFPMLLSAKGTQDNKAKVAEAKINIKGLNINLVNPPDAVPSIADELKKPLDLQQEPWRESYSLTIPEDGSNITLSANTTLGLVRGLSTFTQLWYESNGTIYNHEAPVAIEDWPSYPYRGFMLDTARNFFTPEDILRTLRAMSMVQLNHFRWRIADSQSWPLVVPGHDSLSLNGAYLASSTYNSTEIKLIVDFANQLGIEIVIEIDVPGHMAVVGNAYPEHVACYQASPWSKYAIEPPAGMLRFANPKTLAFTTELLGTVSSMFPSQLFSIGGDALLNATECYNVDSNMANEDQISGKDLKQPLADFILKVHDSLATNRTVMVWDDSIVKTQVQFKPENTIVIANHGAAIGTIVDKDFRFIHASSDYFYLDCGAGGWFGGDPNAKSWCDPFKTWQKIYSFNPMDGVNANKTSLVLGGETQLYSEQTDSSNLDSIVWPRTAAAAAVFWAGESREPAQVAYPKILELRYRMVGQGINAIPLGPYWCTMNSTACDV